MNPYVRVAYDPYTLCWLPYTFRIELLYTLVHTILNRVVRMPEYSPRRLEAPGDEVVEKVWKYDDAEGVRKPGETGGAVSSNPQGSYQEMKRVADPDRFCSMSKLMVLNKSPRKGHKNWENIPLPPVP